MHVCMCTFMHAGMMRLGSGLGRCQSIGYGEPVNALSKEVI